VVEVVQPGKGRPLLDLDRRLWMASEQLVATSPEALEGIGPGQAIEVADPAAPIDKV
jgi:hypothetical protein